MLSVVASLAPLQGTLSDALSSGFSGSSSSLLGVLSAFVDVAANELGIPVSSVAVHVQHFLPCTFNSCAPAVRQSCTARSSVVLQSVNVEDVIHAMMIPMQYTHRVPVSIRMFDRISR